MNYYSKLFFQYALTIFIALSLNFLLPRLAPGDPIYFLLGEDVIQSMTIEELTKVRAEYGLDKPLAVQYKNYLKNVFSGEFGNSISYGLKVSDLIIQKLPWTLVLTFSGFIFSLFFGSLLGVLAAWKHGKTQDILSLSTVLFIGSLPSFWLAMMFIIIFSTNLGLLPSFGAYPLAVSTWSWEWFLGVLERLIMPSMSLGLIQMASILLITRSSMLFALEQDYIIFARSKGISEKRIFFKHAFRNALLPLYTHSMIGLGGLVGGSLVVETVFSYPGLGSLIVNAVNSRDYPMLQGIFIITTISIIVANLFTDLLYPLIDPRTRRSA